MNYCVIIRIYFRSSLIWEKSVVEHTINTGNAQPIKQAARTPPRTLTGKENEIIQEQNIRQWYIS